MIHDTPDVIVEVLRVLGQKARTHRAGCAFAALPAVRIRQVATVLRRRCRARGIAGDKTICATLVEIAPRPTSKIERKVLHILAAHGDALSATSNPTSRPVRAVVSWLDVRAAIVTACLKADSQQAEN
jgi:hypothetical protein